ncbi:MAG: hypothetical protein ACRDID_01995, partial [Ktedonobacterales bacterium]
LSLALLLAGGGLIAMGLQARTSVYAAPMHATHALSYPGNWYGAGSTYWMVEATVGIWPQQASNACGVDTAIGMINYDALNSGASMPEPASSNPESTIRSQNGQTNPTYSPESISQWGHATPTNTTGGVTNIAADFGTDPRSVAYMSWNYSISNRYFHNYIYRWQFSGDNSGYAPGQALDAATLMARGLEAYSEPVIAFINAGAHAVLVTGVYSGTDPASNFPAEVTEVSFRDPEGTPSYNSSSDTSHFTVTIDQWTTYGYTMPSGYTYTLWSQYYGNSQDPDPMLGIYSGSNHWFGGYTWVERDNNYGTTRQGYLGQWDPDWAFDAYHDSLMWTP